jgi:protein-S-isoprenylcysteine O-methyltransferase Ste14
LSVCLKRLIMWLLLTTISVVMGIVLDIALKTESFPLLVHLVGLIGMIVAHFPLKRTGRLLKLLGEQKEWGCTNRLITTDIYKCVRHPHHLGVGIFMTSLGLLIGHVWSFLIITITQWVWVIAFLFLVEEKELREKFGEEYKAYRQQVPMLFPKLSCFISVFNKPIEEARKG